MTQEEWWKLWERPLDDWFWKMERKMKGRKHNVKRKNVKKQQQ